MRAMCPSFPNGREAKIVIVDAWVLKVTDMKCSPLFPGILVQLCTSVLKAVDS